MAPIPEPDPASTSAFDERSFYLAEFRGRTIAVVALPGSLPDAGPLVDVLETFRSSAIGSVVLADGETADRLGAALGVDPFAPREGRFAPQTWRAGRSGPVPVPVPVARLDGDGDAFAGRARRLVSELGITKLVFLHPSGGIQLDGEGASSFVDADGLAELRAGDADPRRALLDEIAATLDHVESINLCTAEALDAELFTYAGSGTLFTRGRYVHVRRLGLDDLDVASAIIARGVEEGFLLPRPPEQLDPVLARAFGAFIEERHLAGICGRIDYPGPGLGELVCVYTLTRFQGEGVGRHLIDGVVRRAREDGLRALVSCTTRDAVARFFLRERFEEVDPATLPPEKWESYDPERRPHLRAFRRALTAPAPADKRGP